MIEPLSGRRPAATNTTPRWLLVGAGLLLAGCSLFKPQPTTPLGQSVVRTATGQNAPQPSETLAGGASTLSTPESASGSAPDPEVYTLDAMVGQVNGQAIYVGTVLEPISDQLTSLGRTLPPTVFRDRARGLIMAQLDQIVTDKLIVGEAERDLAEDERAGLKKYMDERRAELIRKYGRGSETLADRTLLEQSGRGLEQSLRELRQRVVVQRYLQQKLMPKINVTRRDIERHYHENREKFNPPLGRTLRIIRVVDRQQAEAVDRRLAAGESFQTLAREPINTYRPSDGGLMGGTTGDKVFGDAALNEAMVAAGEGRHSPRVEAEGAWWWVRVEAVDRPPGRSLHEVQTQIEQLLRAQRFQALTMEYRQQLYREGSYNPLDQMAMMVLEVAVNRYAVGG